MAKDSQMKFDLQTNKTSIFDFITKISQDASMFIIK